MGFRCGIVGLPNVGKSTLFNALTATAAAEAANYPFCTIEPNTGRVSVPDERLTTLAKLATSAQIIPTQLEFVDIAGLVRGASKGEGLGNKFLAHIREVDAIAHVVRCFEDGNITHVDDTVNPLRDIETIETELMLADMESLEKRLPALEKKAKSGDKDAAEQLGAVRPILQALQAGNTARSVKGLDTRVAALLHLITAKPVVYVCNVSEADASTGNAFVETVRKYAANENAVVVIISAAIESEISMLETADEKQAFLADMGLSRTGLDQLILAGYSVLGLMTFFTIGLKEARAWTLDIGLKAPQAAGVIHTDFERGFICAETIAYKDYVTCETEAKAKEQGKLRLEGKEYVVQDGDVFHFRFNV